MLGSVLKCNRQSRVLVGPTRSLSFRYSLYRCSSTSSELKLGDALESLIGKRISAHWLRDSCQCELCVHQSTQQKLHQTTDDIILSDASTPPRVTPFSEGLRVQWASGHQSTYSLDFIQRHLSEDSLVSYHKDMPRNEWSAAELSQLPALNASYGSLESNEGILNAIRQLIQYGILFVKGVPNKDTSAEGCEIQKLASYFGIIRETFYGKTWDVKNIRNARNIAYTNLNLGLHMDLLSFEHPPRYQILHCLRNRVQGGRSIFVDGFRAASTLRSTRPEYFDTLSTTPVPFQYVNDGHHRHAEHPTIELSSIPLLGESAKSIKYINYAPPFQAPLLLSRTPPGFYDALKAFADLLESPENRFEYTLQEGDAVLFDNRRVLHARTAFSELRENEGHSTGVDGDTNRWLKGCYLEEEDLLDRVRVLAR